jgi:uncharacterized protein (UPF0276 family)
MPVPNTCGIGLRLAHLAELVATRPRAGWLEIHPENFLANPHAAELLAEVSAHYPISFHTVGISVGTASGIDRLHLRRMHELAGSLKPIFVSGHLAWSAYGTEFLNDLLPLPYTEETLRIVSDNIDRVQDLLGQAYLIENPASYVGFQSSAMSETQFLHELVQRTGCGLLCDVSNVVVSAHNMGFDPYKYIDDFPADSVAEIHLGGFTPEDDEAIPGAELWIDTHAEAIAERSWELFAYALRRLGRRPVLVEWDSQLPSLPALLAEAARADRIAAKTLMEKVDAAAT